MSIVDRLQDHEAKLAAAQGWQLCDVYDGTRTRHQILPVVFAAPFNNAEKVLRFVIGRARSGDGLAQRALQIVMKDKK